MNHAAKKDRSLKGESIIDFPEDFIVIDIETTGFSPYSDSIIEISAVKYVDNTEWDSFTSMIRPEEANYNGKYVSPRITSLTGITHEMLADAPSASEVLPAFKEFIGNSVLVGHNVSFDVNFLYDNLEKYLHSYLTNDHIDTVQIFKKLHPEAERHKLSDLAEWYHVDYTGAHRALRDCIITQMCLDQMKGEILEQYQSFKVFQRAFDGHRTYGGSYSKYGNTLNYQRSSIPAYQGEPDSSNPLYGKVCVFSGTLESMTRDAAEQTVINCGGVCGSSVTKKTNYLILGDFDYCASLKGDKSSKQKRAEELKETGYDIDIIPETVFLEWLYSDSD